MSTPMHAESKRSYSWWWGSHISPKNSKWLQENLADMDTKVKAMIKLIDEDADSFARRAEMYYKKRPELMKLVEEFYRAYRALSERYDHATGALRHAHRTMAEAFPNHIPLALPDESSSISSGTETGSYTPERPSLIRALFDPDDMQKDALGGTAHFHYVDRSGVYAEENESTTAKKGLKQLNHMFAPHEATSRANLSEGKVRKGLNFQEEEEKVPCLKIHRESKILLEHDATENEDDRNEIKHLQQEVSQLSNENQNLKSLVESEFKNLDCSRTEVQNLRDAMSKLLSEKEAVHFKNQLDCKMISTLESEIIKAKDIFGKLQEEIIIGTVKLGGAEEECLALEKAIQSLKLDLEEKKKELEEIEVLSIENQKLLEQERKEKENARNGIVSFQEELSQASIENHNLKSQILSDSMHLQLSISEVQNMRDAMFKLGSEKETAILQNQISQERISSLETEIFQTKDEIGKLHDDILIRTANLCSAEEQCLALEKTNQIIKLDLEERKRVLEEIHRLLVEKKNLLEKEVEEKENARNEIKCLQEELSRVSVENQDLKSHILLESMHLQSSRAEVQNMRNAMLKLGSEKEAALMHNQLSLESISNLETEIFQANDEIWKLHEDIMMRIIKVCSTEEQCLALEKANQNLILDVDKKAKRLEQNQMLTVETQNLLEKEVSEKNNAVNEIKCLQEELSQVSIENQNLKIQIVSESLHSQSSRAEVQNMRNAMLRLGSEKEAALMRNQLSLECTSNLETEIIQANDEIRKLHEDIMMGIIKLCNAEEQCLSLDKENQSLRLELEEKKKGLEQIQMMSIEMQNLLEKEGKDKQNARNEIKCLQEELSRVSILNQLSKESISNLGTEIFLAKDEIVKLHKDIVAGIVQLCIAEERCLATDKANQSLKLDLEEKRKALEEVQLLSVGNQNLLEQEIKEKQNARNELKCLQGKKLQLTFENNNLKSQIASESKHLDASRTEVQHLKDAMSKLECEREVQNHLYCDSIATLETEIFRAEDEISKLHEEVLMGIVKLYSAEEQHRALVSANHSLKLVVEETKRNLEELRISLQESEKRHVEVERSLLSREQQYNHSQEKVENMTLDIKTYLEKLKDIEQSKLGLEEEVQQLKDINYNLNKNILSYDLKVKHLQDEIDSLKEINSKFEYEINIHWEDRKSLQHELDSVKYNTNEVDLKNKILIEQMEVAKLNIDSLETLVKELQFSHTELIESCRMLEDEKLQIFNKLKDMDAISEKNVFLENSLFDATMELEELRVNIRVLGNSCETLTDKISTDAAERAALVSQVEVLSEHVEKLSDKNILLENSLADANTEHRGLRSKLRESEESIQFISDENSNILTQKNALFSQVESIQHSLADLDTRHAMLEDRHANLEKEKVFLIAQVMELEDALRIKKKDHESHIQLSKICMVKLENQIHVLREDRFSREEELEMLQQKCISYIIEIFVLQRCLCDMKGTLRTEMQKHESLIQSSEVQQTALQSQIQFLQEQRLIRDEEFEEEQQNSMDSMLEIFILQRCLSDMNEKNFILSRECQRHLEASKCELALISQLKGSKLLLKERVAILAERNSKLRDAINKLSDLLNIDKKLMYIDGGEEAVLQTILCVIRNLLASISDVHDENQLLHMELMVHCTLLKENGLENVFLGQELGKMSGQLLVLQADQHQLFLTCEILVQDVNFRDCMNEVFKSELESLCGQLSDMSKEFYQLKEQKNALEEENSVMLRDALTLEHLYLFFKSSNAGNLQDLKLFGDKICSLSAIKNDHEKNIRETTERLKVVENENKQLMDSLLWLEELRSRVTILEFDMFTTSLFCEELVLQVENEENLLKKKSMELLRACHELHCKQGEVTKLCSKLNAGNKEVDEAKMIRRELEEKITVLLEDQACKDVEIDNCCEQNRMLNEELHRLNGEVEVLRKTEQLLSTELQEKIEEVGKCEGEISKLLHEVQVSVVDGIVLEEKMFELAITFENLDICSLVQTEMLKQSNAHAFELKKKLDDLESENRQLKPILNACIPLFISLGIGIATVEKQAHQLVKLLGNQDNPSSYHQEEKNKTRTVDHSTMVGALELQNLISKVEVLQKLMIDTNSQLQKERLQYTANLEAARIEIEGFKQEIHNLQVKQGKETSRGKNGQLMKDIELDQVSNSNGPSRIQSAESEDQMLKLWETVDRDYNNSASNGHDIEAVDELKSEQPSSEHIAEKELGVDKQEISREMKESQEEWNKRVNERLSSNAVKLFALQTSAQELKAKMERTAKSKHHKSPEHDAISTKLKEAVERISELVDVDDMLRKKVNESSKMCNGEEVWRSDRRQISEQTRKLANQAEKLEFELQKIHHIFPKLEEESDSNRARGGNRRPRVLLRDYIHGRRVEQGRKRVPLCGCIRPKTKE